MQIPLRSGTIIVLCAALLGGCTDFRRALGIDKAPPDEFTVVENAPLTLPPDYGLRPPHTVGRSAVPSPMQEARTTVFKLGGSTGAGGTSDLQSPGEQALVAKAGPTEPNIRQQIDAETAQTAMASNGFVDDLLFWKGPPPPPGQPVDASKEAQRVREAQAGGQPVNAGEPATIERTHRSVFEGLF